MAKHNGDGPYDLGRDMGDEQLREMEARLNRLYSQASEDITRRLDTFMRRWESQEAGMKERLERGLITQDEYNTWVENKILRSVQMQAQIDSLADDMVHVDQLAVQMINGEIPNVYCTAYNFAGYSGETMANMAGYNYHSFATYNANAVRIIVAEDPDLIPWKEPSVDIPKDLRWNRQHIQSAIAQGILAGDDINQLSRRLLPVVNMDANAARRTARTSYVGVQNQARRDAVARINEAGIPMVETWVSVLQANTRDTHLMLHGTHPNAEGLFGEGIIPGGHLLRFPGDPNGDPEQIYNCQCGVKAHIAGIDHSDQDARYEAMMKRDHFDDWVGQRDGYTINGVDNYRLEETRRMLERKKALDSGVIESREARAYRRRQERAQQAPAAAETQLNNLTFSGQRDALENLNNLQGAERETWERAINRTNYEVHTGVGEGDLREHYNMSSDTVHLYETSSSNRTFYHETMHANDSGSIVVTDTTKSRYRPIGQTDFVERDPYVYESNGATAAISRIYENTENAWERDIAGFRSWVGHPGELEDPEFMLASLRRRREFEDQYGQQAASVLTDLADALTLGKTPLAMFGGHGEAYWQDYNHQWMEAWAHVGSLQATGQTEALNAIEQIFPARIGATRRVYNIAFEGGEPYVNSTISDIGHAVSEEILEIRRNPAF